MMFTESRNFGIKILFTIYIFQSEEICFEILKSVNIAKLMNTFKMKQFVNNLWHLFSFLTFRSRFKL